jgi:hypothetical protein
MPGIAVIRLPSVNWFTSNYGVQPCANILFWKPAYSVVSVFWWLKSWFTWTTWHGQQPEDILSKNTFSFSCGSMRGHSWLFNIQGWKCKYSCCLVNYLKKIWLAEKSGWPQIRVSFFSTYFFNSFHSDKYTVSHNRWFQSKSSPSEICGEQARTGKGFSPRFPCQYHATSTPNTYFFHLPLTSLNINNCHCHWMSIIPFQTLFILIVNYPHIVSKNQNHELPTFLWQRATPILVGWFTGCTCKNNSKWYT